MAWSDFLLDLFDLRADVMSGIGIVGSGLPQRRENGGKTQRDNIAHSLPSILCSVTRQKKITTSQCSTLSNVIKCAIKSNRSKWATTEICSHLKKYTLPTPATCPHFLSHGTQSIGMDRISKYQIPKIQQSPTPKKNRRAPAGHCSGAEASSWPGPCRPAPCGPAPRTGAMERCLCDIPSAAV